MRSTVIKHGLPALTTENILHYIQAVKHSQADDKTRQLIETTLATRKDLITLGDLINKLNDAKETINLLHGLTTEQKAQLSQLIKREKEFKRRHIQHIAQYDDYKQFIVEQHQILPLQQTISWWDNNHETFMKDAFWEQAADAAKIQSAKHKESEKRKRKRLHKLLDVREDFKNYQDYYGFSGEDLLQHNSQYLGFLAEIIQKLLKNRRAYPVMITEYLTTILRAIENEKKLITYSMIYRFECADYYKDSGCDDLMAYTCDRIYHYSGIQKDEKKIQPAKRRGLSPELSMQFIRHIQGYAAAHPDDKLVKQKMKTVQRLAALNENKSTATEQNTEVSAAQQQASTIPSHLTPNLGKLILSIEDANHLLNTQDALTSQNITAFITKFNDDIVTPINDILLNADQKLTFGHFMQFKLILQYILQPTLKKLLLEANQQQLGNNPYWYHLVNHLGSQKDLAELNDMSIKQHASPEFNQLLAFGLHLTTVKQRLNREIEYQLLHETSIQLPPSPKIKLTALLRANEISNNDLITLWTAYAKKLKLNHVIQHYDIRYAINIIKQLRNITDEMLRRAANDPIFCDQAIKSFALLDDIKQDLTICLQQEARTNRFHYLFSGRIDHDALLKPLIQPIDKIYALQIAHKIDGYSKDYARYEHKLAVLSKLRATCNSIINDKGTPNTMTEEFETILKDIHENHKFSNSYRFKRRLANLSALSKQYFAPVNERTFSNHAVKMCSLLS